MLPPLPLFPSLPPSSSLSPTFCCLPVPCVSPMYRLSLPPLPHYIDCFPVCENGVCNVSRRVCECDPGWCGLACNEGGCCICLSKNYHVFVYVSGLCIALPQVIGFKCTSKVDPQSRSFQMQHSSRHKVCVWVSRLVKPSFITVYTAAVGAFRWAWWYEAVVIQWQNNVKSTFGDHTTHYVLWLWPWAYHDLTVAMTMSAKEMEMMMVHRSRWT